MKSMNFKSRPAIEVKDLCVCVCVCEWKRETEGENESIFVSLNPHRIPLRRGQQTGTRAEGLLTKNASLPAGRFLSMSQMIFYQSGL